MRYWDVLYCSHTHRSHVTRLRRAKAVVTLPLTVVQNTRRHVRELKIVVLRFI
jgi:hypothetical protein